MLPVTPKTQGQIAQINIPPRKTATLSVVSCDIFVCDGAMRVKSASDLVVCAHCPQLAACHGDAEAEALSGGGTYITELRFKTNAS